MFATEGGRLEGERLNRQEAQNVTGSRVGKLKECCSCMGEAQCRRRSPMWAAGARSRQGCGRDPQPSPESSLYVCYLI
jgi:hypothetical protein